MRGARGEGDQGGSEAEALQVWGCAHEVWAGQRAAPPIVVGEDWDCVAAAKAGVSFLIQGPPGSGKSHQARAIVEACTPRQVYVLSFTNTAVANLRGLPARTMTLDRFIGRVLHRNLLVTPCLILWDEVFYASTNMLARMSKLQVHPDVQFVCLGDPRQLQCPQNSWKGDGFLRAGARLLRNGIRRKRSCIRW